MTLTTEPHTVAVVAACVAVASIPINVWLFWRMRRLEREFEEFMGALDNIFPTTTSKS